ncbi:hypothetical protein K4039_08020 [Lyngbya sp. CCAP 1446/10]|uniref:hypothetical protein n=1 Tax=Lyngbya sp. CCAP 1446/10 TaxID=439293 RepID=UPI0022376FD2|nr:hypothetical protein [Lyngbya sp. CCAP 1446/10]MCW6050029.1 hypothetical protein [Lyngbya sp. CCAP 1446/10]
MTVDSWQLTVGSWQLAVGSWQLMVVINHKFLNVSPSPHLPSPSRDRLKSQ